MPVKPAASCGRSSHRASSVSPGTASSRDMGGMAHILNTDLIAQIRFPQGCDPWQHRREDRAAVDFVSPVETLWRAPAGVTSSRQLPNCSLVKDRQSRWRAVCPSRVETRRQRRGVEHHTDASAVVKLSFSRRQKTFWRARRLSPAVALARPGELLDRNTAPASSRRAEGPPTGIPGGKIGGSPCRAGVFR